MLTELLTTSVGLLTLFTILFMIVMAFFLSRYINRHIEQDTVAKRERDRIRAAAAHKAA